MYIHTFTWIVSPLPLYFGETLPTHLIELFRVSLISSEHRPAAAGEACPAFAGPHCLGSPGPRGLADIIPKFCLPQKPLGSRRDDAPKTRRRRTSPTLTFVCRDYAAPTRPQRQPFSSSSVCAGRPSCVGSRSWMSCYPCLPGQPAPRSSAPITLRRREE
jgi:hypothetical protein